MIINNFENSNFIVNDGASIKEAMSIITTNHRGCVVVVDENRHLMGALSDGDIRRVLVKGVNMISTIDNAVNRNPIFLKESQLNWESEAEKIFSSYPGIHLVPVVDNNNLMVALVVQE